jgi:hypothetical protein
MKYRYRFILLFYIDDPLSGLLLDALHSSTNVNDSEIKLELNVSEAPKKRRKIRYGLD